MASLGFVALSLIFVIHLPGLAQEKDKVPPGKDPNGWEYAQMLTRATENIAAEHSSPAPQRTMLRWAVQGLYDNLNESLPANLKERLNELEKASPKAVLTLLHDARVHLGKRKDLEADRALELSLRGLFARLEPN